MTVFLHDDGQQPQVKPNQLRLHNKMVHTKIAGIEKLPFSDRISTMAFIHPETTRLHFRTVDKSCASDVFPAFEGHF